MSDHAGDSIAPSGEEAFGQYVVYERLGVGGMATVHRAKARGIEGFERIVALKRLLPHLAEDETFVKSFVREAKFASMLQHANIVQLYELGRVGSTYFIAMEHIEGRDLRRVLQQARKVAGPPDVNVTLALLIQLCDALDYAHERTDGDGKPLGLVHRDVSPSNLLVSRSGHLKVIDFGIARAHAQQQQTQDGKVRGKLAYMAPEAITGGTVDARSDIFSVGVIAHELLTAHTLFASKSEYQTLVNVQRREVVAPSQLNGLVPPELDAIVARALARDPEQRYATAAQMRDDLHGVRARYNLSATSRDVETWCTWAFSLRRPGSVDGSRERMAVTARPLGGSVDEDEAAAIAWGGGADGSGQVAHELPEVTGMSRPGAVAARSLTNPGTLDTGYPSVTVAPPPRRGLVRGLALGVMLAVVGIAAVLLLGRDGRKAAASNSIGASAARVAIEPRLASVKFIVEPADATVKIAGLPPHHGMPWTLELDPGVVQIKVTREGHQSWETSIELSGGETQTIRVALAAVEGDPLLATVELGSQPAGLSIVLDGQDVGQVTPWKTQLPPGNHTVQLRQADGAIAWTHEWSVEPRTLYTFAPSMEAAKQRERVARARVVAANRPARAAMPAAARAPTPAPAPPPPPAAPVPTTAAAATTRSAATADSAGTPAAPAPPPAAPAVAKPAAPPPPVVAARAPVAPVAAPRPVVKAVVVAPNAVQRISGELPTLKAVIRPGMEVPRALMAKICIDARGGITSVNVLKVRGELADAFARAIRSWRYTPYRAGGVATPACFIRSFTLSS